MAWTLTAAVTYRKGNYIKVKIACKSDNDAMAATDLLLMDPGGGAGSLEKPTAQTGRTLRDVLEGVTFMAVKADPGTAPDTTWDFTFSDDEGDAIYTSTENSTTVTSWHDMSTDIGLYPPIFNKLYLAFPTDADWTTNDVVDLYLIGWRENPY